MAEELPGRLRRPARAWQFAESPLIDGDNLICTPGGPKATMVALDRKTGGEVWRCPAGDVAGYSSVVISNAGGVKQYVQLTDGGTIGVAAKDGKLLWRYAKLEKNTANIPTPVVLGEQVFTTAGYGKGGALLSLKAEGEGIAAVEEYYNNRLRNKHGGVVVVGDYVYGDTDDSGNPYCAEWKTGEVKWTRREARQGGQGGGSAALTYADGLLFIHYADGWIHLVPAVSTGYTVRGAFKMLPRTENSWAHPVVIGGRLYLRDKDNLFCYAVRGK
ncbi:MAG: PQQ-binding-like beta-propeller repeat protein [Gemmataceae bacterium]